ncbi:uncharacterized protein L3040_000795 [Drepanopeziza brunnea f. sp. 'multigermtubi']|uniref:uncharacterized protein n=1 Tax=Drepanopeziza brunnea f. sp. 'multigermtubi' TaxID=698441 RepID=UPI0023991CFF|nr:hypothetical protein L3040_000795 [Drepanopeziza brunnea f. sp. 'multigermtubi']
MDLHAESFPSQGQECLDFVRSSLGLSTSLPRGKISEHSVGAVYVAIRFKNVQELLDRYDWSTKPIKYQMGVALLDTLDISPHHPMPIETHNFGGGHHGYKEAINDVSLFGPLEPISPGQLLGELEYLLAPYRATNRHVVLVGHGTTQSLEILRALRFDVDATFSDSLDLLDATDRSFKALLRTLRIPSYGLKSAGNAANFSIRALLTLAAAVVSHAPFVPEIPVSQPSRPSEISFRVSRAASARCAGRGCFIRFNL